MIKNVVLLSTADWDNPFWTNKQHVTVELAKQGIKVFYIDSLGLRAPSASKSDFKRIFNRLKRALSSPKNKMDNVWVWSPVILPWHKYSLVRTINKVYLHLLLGFFLKKVGITSKETIFLTYNPITSRLIDFASYKKVVYHCVDEIKAQPGMPVDVIEMAERELLKKANVVFVTSENLYETRRELCHNIHYHSNVADYNHFNKALTVKYNIPDEMKNMPGIKIGFIGAISNYKVDFNLIKHLAESRPDYNIILIGEVGEGEPGTNVDTLVTYENIHFLGPKDYSLLPNYLAYIDVAILPNNINSYTDSMFPMKFFEYLSAGCSVVSVNLKALKDFSDYCYLSKDYAEFVSNIDKVVSGNIIPLEARLSLAQKYTYESRTKAMVDIINRDC